MQIHGEPRRPHPVNGPGGITGNGVLEAYQIVDACRDCAFETHDKIKMERRDCEALLAQQNAVVYHAQIKDLDFRPYPQFKHILCQGVDQIGAVFIDQGEAIDRSCLEIDIQYAVNVKTDVDGSDPIEAEGLEDLRFG